MVRPNFSILIILFFTVLCPAYGYAESKSKSGVTKVYTLPPKMIAEYIDKTEGQKRVLYIYTSWCGYCRKKMPHIMDIERAKKGSVIAVSVDENYADYARYAKKLSNSPFPLILNKGGEGHLKKKLSAYNIKPWNSYPTLIFLDEKGNAVKQGNYTVEQAAKYVLTDK